MPAQKLGLCNKVGTTTIEFYNFGYKDHLGLLYYSHDKEKIQRLSKANFNSILDKVLKSWVDAFEENVKIHEENLPKIAAMKEDIEEIKAFMKQKGFSETYRASDQKSRKIVKPMVTFTSGYMLDISREYKLNDGFDEFVRKFEEIKRKVEELRKICTTSNAINEREKEEKKKKDRNFIKLLELNKQLGNPIDDVAGMEVKEIADELLDFVTRKNNLLGLAHAMLRVRGDWNDGCDIVENAIFAPSNELEETICKAVSKTIESFYDCQDGRVFRDCEWSYSDIFTEVNNSDPELYKLYTELSDIVNS